LIARHSSIAMPLPRRSTRFLRGLAALFGLMQRQGHKSDPQMQVSEVQMVAPI
jgi:hypothetical protein